MMPLHTVVQSNMQPCMQLAIKHKKAASFNLKQSLNFRLLYDLRYQFISCPCLSGRNFEGHASVGLCKKTLAKWWQHAEGIGSQEALPKCMNRHFRLHACFELHT